MPDRRLARRIVVSSLAGAGALVASLSAQQPQTPPVQSSATFRATTRLVVQTVSVKDKDGRPIEGLTAKDFVVTEAGEPQMISFVEFERLQNAPATTVTVPAPGASTASSPAAPAPAAVAITQSQIAAPPPGDIKYRDRRLLVLYFDLTSLPPPDRLRAYNGARKFIGEQMQAPDLVAVMGFDGGAVRVKQDFTDDRPRLIEVVQNLVFGEDKDGDGLPDPETEGTAFGQDDAEFNILNTDRQLAALQTAMSMLRPLPEQKSLVYFASGLQLNGTDNQAQLRATINAAIRSNVAMYPVDARGLVASAPLGDATRQSPGGVNMFSGRAAEGLVTRFQRSQDTLYALGKDTGGKALFDYNDLSLGIVQAQQAITSYYIIGYYSTHLAKDGKFRQVVVTLASGEKADIAFRRGYYADKEFAKFNAADKERQLEEALMLDNPITEITLAVEVNYFQLNRAEYFVPVSVKIPGSELALARRRGAARTVIDLIGQVKDEFGFTQQSMRDNLDIKLSEETAEKLAKSPVRFESGFTLLPGKFTVKVLVRDAETGRIGTFQANFEVPNLEKEDKRVPLSSVVLGYQRVALGDALYNAQKNAPEAVNPLVYEGQKLLPSVTRVFSKGREMLVFLQAYEHGATTTEPLVAFVTFYRDDVKVFETTPLAVTDGMTGRSKAVPLRFSVPLDTLPTGRYDCQVTVLNTTTQKAGFWRAPIVVAP